MSKSDPSSHAKLQTFLFFDGPVTKKDELPQDDKRGLQ